MIFFSLRSCFPSMLLNVNKILNKHTWLAPIGDTSGGFSLVFINPRHLFVVVVVPIRQQKKGDKIEVKGDDAPPQYLENLTLKQNETEKTCLNPTCLDKTLLYFITFVIFPIKFTPLFLLVLHFISITVGSIVVVVLHPSIACLINILLEYLANCLHRGISWSRS